METIVGVKFITNTKTYYFDPKDIQLELGDGVIVETSRGIEFGITTIANKEVSEEEIVSPLKPVIRKATEEDYKTLKKNAEDSVKALEITNKKIKELNISMKLVNAEYTFDKNKLIIYFTAEGRIDFRELVKVLASIFKVRIELRQIYERDDAKMRGALAPCGRPCCCTTHLPDFEKVSIKMAKLQGLALNPQKISGVCGRLMCCLKYENDYYQSVYKKMPKVGSKVQTKDGEGVVDSNNLLKQTVKVKILQKDETYDYKIYKLEELKIGEHQSTEEIDNLPDKEE